jgi:hypothetical protein
MSCNYATKNPDVYGTGVDHNGAMRRIVGV